MDDETIRIEGEDMRDSVEAFNAWSKHPIGAARAIAQDAFYAGWDAARGHAPIDRPDDA